MIATVNTLPACMHVCMPHVRRHVAIWLDPQGRERGGGRNAVVGVRGLFEPGVPMLQCCLFQVGRHSM